MNKPPLLRQIEETLSYTFAKVHDIDTYYHDPANFPDSYRQVMTPEEEMVRDWHGGTAFVNAREQVVGINLYDCELNPERIAAFLEMSLPDLQALNLNETGVRAFAFTDRMPSLVHVNLSQNESLTEIKFLSTPAQLRSLDVYDSRVQALDLPAGLDQLQKLDVSRNQMQSLSFIGDCPELWFVDASDNQIQQLVLPSGFQALQYLFLRKNRLSSLDFENALPALDSLDLRENQLNQLPDLLLLCPKLQALFLHGNSLSGIPKEFIASGERANTWIQLRDYWQSIADAEKTDFLYQAKLILVGNEMVGKTSIRLKLLNPKAELPAAEERTKVLDINVEPYLIKELEPDLTGKDQPLDFQLNIWDFGGQGEYREVQQLFCSRKSLYIFVTSHDDVEENKYYVGFNYWMNMVNAYGFDEESGKQSPVIHVVNKIDLEDLQKGIFKDIDQVKTRRIFPNIVPRFLRISCETRKNFPELEETIREVLPNVSSDIFNTPINQNWLAVKAQLEDWAKAGTNHISFERYLELCQEKRLTKSQAKTWISYLDRIGSVIYFGEHEHLKNWLILNPIWIKEVICRVLDAKDEIEDGLLKTDKFSRIWSEYSEEDHRNYIELMGAYQLCFERKDRYDRSEYIVPALLPEREPKFPTVINGKTPVCKVRFDYAPFIPAGTINKFIVSLQEEITRKGHEKGNKELFQRQDPSSWASLSIYQGDLIWKNNAIIHDAQNNAYGHIWENWKDKAVYLDLYQVSGDLTGKTLRPIYEAVHAKLHELNTTLKTAKYLDHLDLIPWMEVGDDWLKVSAMKKLQLGIFGAQPMQPSDNISFQFLAACPSGYDDLKIRDEHDQIVEELEKFHRFDIWPSKVAVKDKTLLKVVSQQPQIIHFAGHGEDEGLVLENENGDEHLLPNKALRDLFREYHDQIQLIVLNACYSASQAKTISEAGIYVVGMNDEIEDEAALDLAFGIYSAIGHGTKVDRLFSGGKFMLESRFPDSSEILEVWFKGDLILGGEKNDDQL
jgi:GTPase SAR1 family protein